MALNGLLCANLPLRNYSLAHADFVSELRPLSPGSGQNATGENATGQNVTGQNATKCGIRFFLNFLLMLFQFVCT